MAAHLVRMLAPEWTLAQTDELHRTYFKNRHTANVTEIGRLFEAAFSLYLAEMHRRAGNESRARELIGFSVECFPNLSQLRTFEEGLPAESLPPIEWTAVLLPAPSTCTGSP
jgi:hypothetical protein